MLTFVKQYGSSVTSQHGENGIIAECLKRISPELKVAVEFGAPDQMYCSNIYPLKQEGWDCYYYDNQSNDPFVTKKEITENNINELPKCSIISMDTDGLDYALFMAYNGKPDIVIIEINSGLSPMQHHYHSSNGASYISMLNLGIAKGYFLLCHTGNMILILNKHRHLFPEVIGNGIDNWEEYFNKSWL